MAPRPAPAPAPAPAAALMDELVEEILFRIPPDDPARLLHAALVCKRWGRIVSDPGFRRRFREFHRAPPLFGFFHRDIYFVPTTSFRRPPINLLSFHRVMDARHGRVLLQNLRPRQYDENRIHLGVQLTVWDPITGDSSELLLPPMPRERNVTWNLAVLCAYTGGACDHLDCARGHFLVVYVYKSNAGLFAHVYSSETAAWSEIPAQHLHVNRVYRLPSAVVGNALYFVCTAALLKYDLVAREMSLIRLPSDCVNGHTMLTGGDRLGRADVSPDRQYLYLWSSELGPDEGVGWAQRKVINLRKLLPDVCPHSLHLAGFAHGLDVILVGSSKGIFTIDLKSVKATKVHEGDHCDIWFPYMSFYTPALRAACAEESRTGTSAQMPDKHKVLRFRLLGRG